jgi:uncharacterized protein (TIGR03067 family)
MLKYILWTPFLVLPITGDPPADQDLFQGKWTFLVLEERSKKFPHEAVQDLEVAVKEDRLTVTEKNKVIAEFKFKIDARKKPKAVDFTHTSGTDKGLTELGIYQFEGDMVILCMDEEGKTRPKEFDAKEKTSFSLVILKKKK